MSETARQAVLIIDDEPNNIEILSLDLEDEDYDILTAANGLAKAGTSSRRTRTV